MRIKGRLIDPGKNKFLLVVNFLKMFCLCPIPGQKDPRSRVKKIPDPGSGSASKNLRIFYPDSRKNDLGCSSMIPDPDFFPSRIPDPDPGVKKAPDGSRIRIRNTAHKCQAIQKVYKLTLTFFLFQPEKSVNFLPLHRGESSRGEWSSLSR
jgi:hypothetical protein